jgi:hypothetical protein
MRVAVACAVLVALGGACSTSSAAVERADARTVEQLEASGVPVRLNGLVVEREDVGELLDRAKRPYLDATALYSMREGDLLRATLQIGRFADDADVGDEELRAQIVNRIGSGTARTFRIGDRSVWLTSGDRQTLAVWFEDRHVFVLATRDDYELSRSLLRATLEVRP